METHEYDSTIIGRATVQRWRCTCGALSAVLFPFDAPERNLEADHEHHRIHELDQHDWEGMAADLEVDRILEERAEREIG